MKTLSLQEMVEFSIGLQVWTLFVISSGAHLSSSFFQFDRTNELLSTSVCNECVMNINNFYSFKQRILIAHNQLESQISENGSADMEALAEDSKDMLGAAGQVCDEEEFAFLPAEVLEESEIVLSSPIRIQQASPKKRTGESGTSPHAKHRNRKGSPPDRQYDDYKVSVQVNECLVCPSVLTDIMQLNEHTASHLQLKCKMCKRDFLRYSNLKRHFSERHSKPKPFVCDICGLGFSFSINLEKHAALHRK